jgi:formate hydrogenlyase subunit 6/NADH:ubiquinone oxidoreductase subunit I
MIRTIRDDTCLRCGICDAVCPADVIHTEPVSRRPTIRYMEHCITCFNCEIFCPTRSIDVYPIVKGRPTPW